MQFDPYYFFKDSLEVFIKSFFSTAIIFNKFQLEATQSDNYCRVDFVQLEKLDQFLSKAQMAHIMLHFPTIKSTNSSHNVVFSNISRTFWQCTIRLDPHCPYKGDIQMSINSFKCFC